MTSSSGVKNACEDNRELLLLLLLTCGALIASGVSPFDRGTWLMEVAPVFIGLPLLWATELALLRLSKVVALPKIRLVLEDGVR